MNYVSLNNIIQLNYDQKNEICKYTQRNPKVTLDELGRIFEKKFSLNLNDLKKTTFSGILKKSDSILNTDLPIHFEIEKRRTQIWNMFYFCGFVKKETTS